MTTERKMVQTFVKELKKVPEIWCYKIPDVPTRSTKKPFDVVICYRSLFVAIEFKRQGVKLTKYQTQALRDVSRNGGMAFVGVFQREARTERSLLFYPVYNQKQINYSQPMLTLPWRNSKYPDIDILFFGVEYEY